MTAMYARGWRWYSSLFASAREGDLRGESSTHYTKLPDYPRTVARMVRDLPRIKLIYVMRHPIDRLMSHYVHELTTGRIKIDIHDAIERHHELIEYSRYAMQLGPFVDAYGFENILPVFFPRLVRHSQSELERIGRFLEPRAARSAGTRRMKPQNRGKERLRPSPIRQRSCRHPSFRPSPAGGAAGTGPSRSRSCGGPRSSRRPCDPSLIARLRDVFDADLAQLGSWLGITLDCETFKRSTVGRPHDWASGDLRLTQAGDCDEPATAHAATPARPADH